MLRWLLVSLLMLGCLPLDGMAEDSTTNRVQLGCGTLIIIALIVMVFSGGSDARMVREQLEDMNRKLDRLEKKVDDLSERVSRLPPSAPVERK